MIDGVLKKKKKKRKTNGRRAEEGGSNKRSLNEIVRRVKIVVGYRRQTDRQTDGWAREVRGRR